VESHQLINQTSGSVEWYTPPEIIEAARKTLGFITLDPFSCAKANENVKASIYYTKEDDGFNKPFKVRLQQKWED
jgi:ParB family chromosome partitioning protein